MGGLLVAAAILIGISGIPRFKDGHGINGVIGGIGWFGGLLCVLAFLILAGRAIVLAVRRRGVYGAGLLVSSPRSPRGRARALARRAANARAARTRARPPAR